MICGVCSSYDARVRHVTQSYGRDSDLLVIENVPAVNCPRCGESYMTAETMHELDRIKANRGSLDTPRPVAVASY